MFRTKLSALTVMATLVVAMFGAPIAAAAQQQRCAAWHHPCGTTEAVSACCCRFAHGNSTPAAIEARDQNASVQPDAYAAPPTFALMPSQSAVLVVQTTPRGSPPDLPTLYAALLI